ILIPGTIAGFLVSWQIKDSKPQHMDTFTGMLSLAAMVIILGGLYDTPITFENLLKVFATALAWLTLFQSFGLKSGKSYAILQFISVCLFISSVALVLEEESLYVVLIAVFLFIFIFAMRLNLVCEKKRKGSFIVGDRETIMSLWQQIKVGAIMFSFVLIVASLVYPFVPRFENLSLKHIPSTLLGIPEQVPLLKLLMQAPRTIKEDKRSKKDQRVDDDTRKRETERDRKRRTYDEDKIKQKTKEQEQEKKDKREKKEETTERFRAKEFNKSIDMFKIESLDVDSNTKAVPVDGQCKLSAELKMSDGSTIPATKLVDWKITGTAKVSIDSNGDLTPKEEGYVYISASYLGSFSNDIKIDVTKSVVPLKKKSWLYYLVMTLLWFLILALLYFAVWIFIKSKRLSELAIKNPKEFIKEVYAALCRGFRPYGVLKFDYVAPREFFQLAKGIMISGAEPMHTMTEDVLEARFSTHEISGEHSWKTLGLFHDVKDIVLDREEGKYFWRKILFRLLLLDVLLVPKRD
ncbi:MAG: Ig-like domain-containing protein, partial [Candidatus Omnitrophica bacterium]|nr:Ig-like domain-containing protein [Candidatus Omnitrophota bacterium]